MSTNNKQLCYDISSDEVRKALFHLKHVSKQMENIKFNTKNNVIRSNLHQISFNQFSNQQFQKKQPKDNKQTDLSFKIYTEIYNENCNDQNLKKPKKLKLYRPTVKNEPLINQKSKEIMMKKEKLGNKYIPIHLRTQNQIRKKNQNISKIRDQLMIKTEISLKQCTFKPSILKSPNNHQRKPAEVVSQLYRWQQKTKQKLTQMQLKKKQEGQTSRNKQNYSLSPRQFNDKQSLIKVKKNLHLSKINNNPLEELTKSININTPDKPISNRKLYKNKDFNFLLDLIH